MKKIIFLASAALISVSLTAQQKRAPISSSLARATLPEVIANDEYISFDKPVNPIAASKAAMDAVIGSSEVYDNQTNASMQNRLQLFPDGTLSATWIKSDVAGNADRGTGYNHYNGSAWGPAPFSRLESVKAGWPCVAQWNGNGEVVISHRTTINLVMNTRTNKGTGSWTETMTPTSPAANAPLVWPAVITNGNNHQNIHILALTRKVANGGTIYKGLDGALLYYRSLDGGNTWDINGIQFPGLDSSNYLGFNGDNYVWIEPHGDTLAFVCGGNWVDTFLMTSYDNGLTWTKKPILPNYYCKNPVNTQTPTFICCDGSLAGTMDKDGVIHVAFGRMRARDDGTGHKYYPGTDGIVYWNSTMPVLDTAIVHDIDTLFAHGLLIAYVAANEAGDSILDPFPKYGVSLSSFPQVNIDEYNNLYFLWSSLTVGNPSPDPLNYRHIWGRAWYDGKPEWTNMTDLNADIIYLFQEYVYPAVAKKIKNGNLQMITQTSSQPGSNVNDETIPVHPVNIEHREVPTSTFIMAGKKENSPVVQSWSGQVFPNPARNMASVAFKTAVPALVSMVISDLSGKIVTMADYGEFNTGAHTITFDVRNLPQGIYFAGLKIGNELFTRKLVVTN